MTGKTGLFPGFRIPSNSAGNWKRKGVARLQGSSTDIETANLRIELQQLKDQVKELQAKLSLICEARELVNERFRWSQLPEAKRTQVLNLIDMHRNTIGLKETLAALAISRTRYKNWRRLERCPLPAEKRSCVTRRVNRLTVKERKTMVLLVTFKKYVHFSIKALALYTQRKKILFANRQTWYRYIHQNGWVRPYAGRRRKPYLKGIQAKVPNQIWHIDLSYYKLSNGETCFIQAIIDNFSRYVLAWKVTKLIAALNTVNLLRLAVSRSIQLGFFPAEQVYMDSGTENVNHEVSAFLVTQEQMKRVLAKVDVHFSNARFETLFRSMAPDEFTRQVAVTAHFSI